MSRAVGKTLYLLIGPKGSGKSYIGSLLDRYFGIRFVRVEEWARRVKRGRAINDESYLQEVFDVIERGVRQMLESADQIVFESTGLTGHFDTMLARLQADFVVVPVGVRARSDLCLQRVRERDASIHIDVSDAQVMEIHRAVMEKDCRYEYEIENSDKSEAQLLGELKIIINRSVHNS